MPGEAFAAGEQIIGRSSLGFSARFVILEVAYLYTIIHAKGVSILFFARASMLPMFSIWTHNDLSVMTAGLNWWWTWEIDWFYLENLALGDTGWLTTCPDVPTIVSAVLLVIVAYMTHVSPVPLSLSDLEPHGTNPGSVSILVASLCRTQVPPPVIDHQ